VKYRKKPIVIEAEQYLEGHPLVEGVCKCLGRFPHVHTIHDNQIVVLDFGDWIIPEPDGVHYYPCKPDIFAETYDLVVDPDESDKPTDRASLLRYLRGRRAV
jgi:hypothetical protein